MDSIPGIDNVVLRAKIVSAMRAFFDARGFVEVDTPVRIAAPAPEPHIDCPEVFAAGRNADGRGGFLRASPELQMKKLLAAGMGRIYQIGPCFREGERGRRHNPEFTMLEWYRADAGYEEVMADAEALVAGLFAAFPERVAAEVADSAGRPFRRLQVRDAYRTLAEWDPFENWDADRFDFDMATKIEPGLPREPTFLVDYPPAAASLSRIAGPEPVHAERWELYVGGVELANAFSELTDPEEQRRRFEAARDERRLLGEADYPVDEEFLSALGEMRPSGGVALGVDRLVMLLAGENAISAVRVGDEGV